MKKMDLIEDLDRHFEQNPIASKIWPFIKSGFCGLGVQMALYPQLVKLGLSPDLRNPICILVGFEVLLSPLIETHLFRVASRILPRSIRGR